MDNNEDHPLIAERRAKLAALREQGNAFPNDFHPDAWAGELHERYADTEGEALEAEGKRVRVAGRMMEKRVMGKTSFAKLQDVTGRIQLLIQRDAVGTETYQAFKGWDLGDILGAEGTLTRTKTGELSIKPDTLRLLTKSLRPLPEKYHGLTDLETRYRQRYLDLIMNPESRATFKTRSAIVRYIRDFMEDRGFLEVETPMMQQIPGGAAARPFVTHHNALDLDLYLRVAPELFLKRLVVGGLDRVYEINRNFRNEGVSTRHNPEFTMLEFYQAYAEYDEFMDLIETMLRGMADKVLGTTKLTWQGVDVDLGTPFARVSLRDAVVRENPELGAGIDDLEQVRAHLRKLGAEIDEHAGLGKLQLELFEHTVEDKLLQPIFITQYPTEISPLSRRNDDDPFVTDRFELFIAGQELANGFSELNDPEDQAERFREQAAEHAAGDAEAMVYDADYVHALEYGLPPTAGAGIGIDRLTMLFTDSASIRDVLLFPYMRPKQDAGQGQEQGNTGPT